AGALRGIRAPLTFRCGPVASDLAHASHHEVRVSTRFAAELSRRLACLDRDDARARLTLTALTELAAAMADPLRLRAQRWLAAATGEAQSAAFELQDDERDAARTITAAVAAVVRSRGVCHQPDVERH